MARRKKSAKAKDDNIVEHGSPSSVHLGEETVPENRKGTRDLEATKPKRKRK